MERLDLEPTLRRYLAGGITLAQIAAEVGVERSALGNQLRPYAARTGRWAAWEATQQANRKRAIIAAQQMRPFCDYTGRKRALLALLAHGPRGTAALQAAAEELLTTHQLVRRLEGLVAEGRVVRRECSTGTIWALAEAS